MATQTGTALDVRDVYWLGRSYYRGGEKGSYVLSFGLDFRS